MTLESLITIGATVLSIALAPIVYVYRSIMQRLEALEQANKNMMSKEDVRVLIEDKTEAMKSDLDEIKVRLDRIIDRLLDNK